MANLIAMLKEVLPITGWLPEYAPADLRGDAMAGLTVGVMLIPQGMAYALIAELPPIYGLYAGLLPLLTYPLFATSRHLSFGPSALDMVIVAAGVGALAETGTPRYVALAIVLTAMAGLMQIGMGLARFGFVAMLLSRPVITGLTTAAALIISFSQLGNVLGMELSRSKYVHVLLWEALRRIGEVDPATCAVSLGSIAVLVGLKRWAPRWPGALVVVAAGALGSALLEWEAAGIEVIGAIPQGLPGPTMPAFTSIDLRAMLPAALTLGLVQFMKNISLARVFAARHRYAVDANRELIGMGAANLAGSFFSSIPVSGSFSRSAVNEQAGARTPLANVFAALIIGLTLLFLTPLFYHLPMAVLGAIIMVAAFGLIDADELRDLFRTRQRDGYIGIFTAACVLTIGIQEGILLGIGATMLAMLYRISRPNVAELGHVPGTRLFRDLGRFDEAVRIEGILVLRVDAAFSFANAEYFKEFILDKSEREGRQVEVVVIDGTSINDLDTTATDALRSVVRVLRKRGIELYFTGLIGPVREVMVRSGLIDEIGGEHFQMGPHDAVVHVLEEWDKEDGGDRVPRYFAKTEKTSISSTDRF